MLCYNFSYLLGLCNEKKNFKMLSFEKNKKDLQGPVYFGRKTRIVLLKSGELKAQECVFMPAMVFMPRLR